MEAVSVKVVKPRRMDQAAFERIIEDALRDAERGILKDFEDTTETWEHEVEFKHGHSLTQREGRAFVETEDEIYGYVNEGTKAHRIPKRGFAKLRFQWGGKGSYKPKTKPGRFGSRPGGPSGPVVSRAWVWHPGTKAREFDKLIQKRWQTLLPRALQDALGKGAKVSGHG